MFAILLGGEVVNCYIESKELPRKFGICPTQGFC